MANVGFATLSVIPSFQGFQSKLSAGVAGPLTQAGRDGGRRFGDAAGKEAGGRFKSGFGATVKGFAAPMAGLLAGAGIADFFHDAFSEAKEAGEVSRVTAKLIETTGHAANLTATQMGDLAQKMMDYAAVDDEMVQSGANVMLTFRNVRNEIGAGNDVFNRSIKAALDLSTVLGTDLNGSAIQLGKALNDPIKGVTALGRAGVQFTEGQKSRIESLVKGGDLLAAQRVILDEVEHQVGGAAGAAADGTDRLAVAMGNLKEAAGEQLMPAVEAVSDWAVDQGIPAMMGVGGAVRDTAEAFGQLPPPVKAAAGAFVALQVASRIGLTDQLRTGVGTASSAMDSLRVRTMLAADAFRSARSGVLEFSGNSGRFVAPVGRMSAALTGLKAGAQGAGSALTRGLSGAVGLIGGPWGAALIGGTAILGKFWHEHQEAKQHVDDLKASLDQQTGAITKNTRATIAKALEDEGTLKNAKSLGFSLDLVTDAAMGQTRAIDTLRDAQALAASQVRTDASGSVSVETVAYQARQKNIGLLIESLTGQNTALDKARESSGRLAEATGESSGATGRAATAAENYKTQLDKARGAVQKLIDAEQKRRDAAVANKRDQVALQQAMADAREEANKGKRTLDQSTQAGRDNWNALLDLSDQWNNSKGKVQNARGAYRNMRQTFIEVATEMGKSKKQAEELADRFLKLPHKKAIHVDTPGMDKALADMKRLRWLAEAPGRATLEVKLKGDSYAGMRAQGGNVNAGSSYLVGERGPEVVTFPRKGHVYTAEQSAAGAGGNHYEFNFNGVDLAGARREADHVRRATALGGADFR